MNNMIKRMLAFLLAVALCVSALPIASFAASGDSGKLRVLYNVFSSEVGDLPSIGHITTLPAKAILSNGIYKAAYCLEQDLNAGDSIDYTWADMSWDKKFLVGNVLALGFQWKNADYWKTGSAENYKWAVCQFLVWAIEKGTLRSSNGEITFDPQIDKDMATAAKHSTDENGMVQYYNQLKSELIKLHKIPSFAGRTASTASAIKLTWDGSQYSASVTDTNGVLDRFDFHVDGVTVNRSGNTLKITADAAAAAKKEITSQVATYSAPGGEGAVAVWKTSDASYQSFGVYSDSGTDPIPAYIKVTFDTVSTAKLVKTSEDGKVSGIRFRITGSDGSSTVKTTGPDGSISLDGMPIYQGGSRITYTAEELDVPAWYVQPEKQTFQFVEGQEVSVRFENKLKKGTLEVTKTSEDGLVQGIQFRLTGTAQSGTSVTMTAATNSSGVARFENVPIGTGYTLEEVGTAEKYVVPASQSVSIEWNQVARRSFHNVLKRGDVVVTKNAEDGLTEGLTFRLHGTSVSGQAVDETATTGADGKAYFRDVLIGKNYVLEEEGTPERYVIPDSQTAVIQWEQVTNKTFENTLKRGDLTVTKTSEDDVVEGMRFHLYGTSLSGQAVDEYAVTGPDGKAHFEDILIGTGYVLEEVDTPDRYIVPANQTADIQWNTVTEKTFENKLKRGDLIVTKTAEDGLTEGITFRLSGTSYSGIPVNETATVGKDGKANFKNILIGTSYTLEEVDTAVRYVVPAKQTQIVEWNKVTQATVQNILKKWNVTVTKRDGETCDPQGNAKLAGAVYGVYKGDELIDTYTTDASGSFTTSYYVCGDNWHICEVTPSEGYLLDETTYHVGAEAENYTVEYNAAPAIGSPEDVIKGKIDIIKHTDNGDTQIETPETGATFEVYLKSAGSYEAAKESERDVLTCDEYGFAASKDLPYGVYTVHQTSGWEGRQLFDFEVFIAEDGKTYHFIVNNANYASYLKIVKKDAETGQVIPAAGIGFEIYRPDGSKVEMSYTYPTPTTISVFYTNAEGYLVTPEKLEYGKGYALKEVQAPYGYVLNSEPVHFDVVQEDSEVEGSISVIVVELSNAPQKGTISVGKTGEVFSSVTESDGVYQPIYTVQGLPGAVYEITAAEDIVTLDGTLRYSAGEVVDTVTTDETGSAKSKALYLGKYTVAETKAPEGCVLNAEPITVELTYAGQDVELTETATDFYNDRQKVSVSLDKALEQDERFQLGMNGEITAVTFGLYAAEDVTAADSTLIPKDGLIEIASVAENGNASIRSDLPFGSYYLKEIATDSHYLLSDEKYAIVFEYAGQELPCVEISANDGKGIENKLLRGKIQGLKVDRETGTKIADAVFGLFAPDAIEYTEKTAILTATSNEEGVFLFEDVPYGSWTVVELSAPEGYLLDTEPHHIHVTTDGEVIEFTAVNDKIPELKTTASTETGKSAHPSDRLFIEDVVEYKHLVPGKEYKVVGTLMDKATGTEFLVDGHTVFAEAVFTPEQPSGSVTVTFSFDATSLTETTDLVVFETLYKDGIEIAAHTDIEDESQTVTVLVPKMGTHASVDGDKDIFATEVVTLEDSISYENLIPGLTYTLQGTVMDKNTRSALVIDGAAVAAETSFTPDSASGKTEVAFTFDSKSIRMDTDLVVFETLYTQDVDNSPKELYRHMDWGSDSQTVHVHVPKIGTTASVGGAKEAVLGGKITVEDVVAYENLTPGVEYVLYGWLVNKGTGERFKADGKNVLSERTFKPKQSEGTVQMSFTFDSSGISETTDLVVYEQLTREGVEIAVHENLEDADQTVTLTKGTPSATPKPEAPDKPETGDRSGLRLWLVLGISLLLGAAVFVLRSVRFHGGDPDQDPEDHSTDDP